jgi:hypothetical protein
MEPDFAAECSPIGRVSAMAWVGRRHDLIRNGLRGSFALESLTLEIGKLVLVSPASSNVVFVNERDSISR